MMDCEPELYKGGRTLSIMPTYACPAQCNNCGTVSSPHDRNAISLATMISAIEQAKGLGFLNVVFTGGEPTLKWEDLLEAIRFATNLDLPTRVVTNAHWAGSPQAAKSSVRALVEAGLKEINYSTGDEHIRFVPLGHVVNAIIAALECALSPAVMIELRAVRGVTRETVLAQPLVAALPKAERDRLKVFESPWMPLDPLTIESYPEGAAFNSDNVAAAASCDSVLQTYVIQADGRVGACCGIGMRITPELNVGRCEGAHFLEDAVREAESDLVKLLLRYKGPAKLLAWAATKDPAITWENLYAHKCQSCIRLYKDARVAEVVRKYHAELVVGALQAAWLNEEFCPRIDRAARSLTAAGRAVSVRDLD